MHSSRDLATARTFHRRRVVAAFGSGRGHDSHHSWDEPPRTLRCVVAGMLVGAVCASGVGVSCAVIGHPEVTWVHGGVHLSP